MSPIPTTRFRLNRDKKRLYKELKICRKNILKKYKFSPANTSRSPVFELYHLYEEYAKTNPDVLYFQLVKLCRRKFFRPAMGNICVGIVSGVVAGLVSPLGVSFYQAAADYISLLVCFITSIVSVVILSCYCDFAARFTLPLFMPNTLNEKEMEIIGELLNIKQYFSIHNLEAPGILKVQRPLRKATHIKKFKGVVKKQTTSACRFAKKCI